MFSLTFAIAIANVTVVDVETGALKANQTIVIAGNRIIAAGDAARRFRG